SACSPNSHAVLARWEVTTPQQFAFAGLPARGGVVNPAVSSDTIARAIHAFILLTPATLSFKGIRSNSTTISDPPVAECSAAGIPLPPPAGNLLALLPRSSSEAPSGHGRSGTL